MLRMLVTGLATTVACLPLAAQTWNEQLSGEVSARAETTVGSGPLTQIAGTLATSESADIYCIQIDDPANFTCSSVGGASFDSQLWLLDLDGGGISFRDDDVGSLQSTLSGQFVPGPGRYLVAISEYDNDALNGNGDALWLDQPFTVERQPDGPGAGTRFTQWSALSGTGGNYLLTLTGASFAYDDASGDPLVAWAWVDTFSASGSPVPSLSYQSTPTGQRITTERLAQGQYEVRLPRHMGQEGLPTVSAYSSDTTPVVQAWGYLLPDYLSVFVDVFDNAGNLTDSPFCFHYRNQGKDDDRAAYCWANNASPTAPYTPNQTFQWNGGRADITIEKLATGSYRVLMPDLGTSLSGEFGNVQVSSYSGYQAINMTRTQVQSWFASGPDLQIFVRTFDATGAAADARFCVSYHEKAAPIAENVGSGAHVWANVASATVPYAPDSLYEDNNSATAGATIIERTGLGAYRVDLPGLAPSASSQALVSSYGSNGERAYINFWGSLAGATGTSVLVNTVDASGAPADVRFSLLYLTDDPAGTPARSEVIGTGCGGLTLTANNRPVLDTAWDVSLTSVPATAAIGFVSVGLNNPNFPLSVIGAPGCFAYQDQVALLTVPLPAASPSYTLSIPNNVSLIGFQVYTQGGVIDIGANALNLLTSNGVVGTVGDV